MSKKEEQSTLIDRLESLAKAIKLEQKHDSEKKVTEGESFNNSFHEQRLAEFEREERKDYLSARIWWRRGIGTLLTLTVIMHLSACVVLFWRGASDNVLGAVTISLTIEVLGLAAIILSHLFPKKK